LRKLSREYGWSALGVYLSLSALDFPFCYLLVRTLGTERIGEWEHTIINSVRKLIPWYSKKEKVPDGPATEAEKAKGWGVEEADARRKKEGASMCRVLVAMMLSGPNEHANEEYLGLATQLALAYAIHKSFIFVRVPLTAAITPKVVRVLRRWGWDIGKRKPRAPKLPTKKD